jgi:hypothetical protein
MAAALVIFGVARANFRDCGLPACGRLLTKLYVSAQVALPDWASDRGLATF